MDKDIPYRLNPEAIHEFMRYHSLEKYGEVAQIMGISAAYLSQLLNGARQLNEHMRLRLQLITRKSQDQLFVPNFDNALFSPQAFAMRKHYGVLPMLEPIKDDPQLTFGKFEEPELFEKKRSSKNYFYKRKAQEWLNPLPE